MGASIVNLTVHGIGETTRQLDPGEDATWVSVAQFEQVLDAVAGRPGIRITFDDGNASDVEIALPRLLERGLTAEFFVLAGLLGKPGRLTRDGVRELAKAGMPVGSHGWAHRDWRRIDERAAVQELADAHRVIADLTGQPVSRVAIPFGSYDRRVLRRLRHAGVTRAYTSDSGRADPDAWLQARNSLVHDLDAGWIEQVLNGGDRIMKLAARVYKRFRG
ncbi:polysaccharide deacetylase family protein [Nonomuraea sp. NPDC005983]|uniref:polysaccharide deacetylase family protein n=1 Tax=Nonomuraea sp. NPDC005983 TaxID=3155595 RepID=UPI0033B877E0